MEKIYEENRKKKQSFFQQFFNNKGSMIAVIVVAVVAIVGLVAFGFNQISFATDGLGGEGVPVADFVSKWDGAAIIGQTDIDGVKMGFIPFMKSDGSYVICTEYMLDYIHDKEYFYNQPVYDAGLIYLITELDKVLPSGNEKEKIMSYWLKQTAVWAYLYEDEDKEALNAQNASRAADYSLYTVGNLKIVNKLYNQQTKEEITANTGYFWTDYGIESIYTAARGKKNSSSGYNYSIKLGRENDKISMSSDGKYYITSLYSVTSPNADSLIDYVVDLSDAPEGTLIYDANGEQEKDIEFDHVYIGNPATKFKLMIPVDKVTDENKMFDISVFADFKGAGFVEYVSEGYQSVVDEGTIYESADDKIGVEINYTPNVPNTGMTTAQTIYFIGLIILLGGVGIIYANAKPQENN